MGADVAQQPAHAQPGAHEREQQAHGEQRQVGHRQQVPLLVEAVHARADQRGDRQEEREIGGGLARQAQQHAADDGGAAAARARHHGQALHQAHFQCVQRGHVVHGVHAHGTGRAPLGPEDDEAAQDEGGRHDHRREEVLLDRLAEDQREHHGRQEADEHVEREALGAGLGGQRHQGLADFLPVHQHDREDRAGLDGDVEYLGLVVVETEQSAREDQVAGGGDGKELGQALDHAHDGGLGQQDEIHGNPFSCGGKAAADYRGSAAPCPAVAAPLPSIQEACQPPPRAWMSDATASWRFTCSCSNARRADSAATWAVTTSV